MVNMFRVLGKVCFSYFFVVLGVKPRASHVQDKGRTIELTSQSCFTVLCVRVPAQEGRGAHNFIDIFLHWDFQKTH